MRSWLSALWRRPPEVWAFWIGLGLLALGVACRLHVYLLSFPIWRDEASLALNFVSRDFRGLLDELDNFQVAPLLFLWIEKAVYEFLGSSAALLRLAPMLAGLSGLVVFWYLARRCLTPLPAALAVGFLAVAQSPIHLTSMVKPYSFDLFAATILLALVIDYLRAPERSRCLAALALSIPLLVTASYPAIFVAGAVSLVLLPVVWRQAGRGGRIWFLSFNVLCLATFAAQLQFVGHSGHDATLPTLASYMAGYWDGGFLPREPSAVPRWRVHCHSAHLFSYPLAFNGGGLFGLLLVVVGVLALYRQRRLDLLGLCLLPCSERFTLNCLRWQLLSFGEQVCNIATINWPRLEQSGGRLWFLDQMVEQSRACQEIPVRDTREIAPQVDRENWHDAGRVRFLVCEPKPGTQHAFHYCCDLHVLEDGKSHNGSIIGGSTIPVAFEGVVK